MPRPLRWVLRGLVAIAGLLVLGVIALYIILNTRPGTGWALDRGAAAVPGALHVTAFDGTLWRGLHEVRAQYDDAGLELHIEGLAARLDWAALVRGRIMLPELDAGSLRVRLPDTTGQPPQPFELDIAPLPRSIEVGQAVLTALVVERAQDAWEFKDLRLSRLRAEADRLRLEAFSAAWDDLSISAGDLDMRWSGDAPVRLDLAWTLADPPLSGHGEVRGSLVELAFDQAVEGAYPGTLNGTARVLHQENVVYDLSIAPRDWQFGAITVDGGTLRMAGTPDDYLLEADVQVSAPQWATLRLTGKGRGDLESLAGLEARLQNAIGDVNLAGNLAWAPDFTARLDVQFADLDASILHADLAGRLQGSTALTLAGLDVIDLADLRVSGLVNDLPLSTSGDLALVSGVAKCSGCVLTSGANRLAFDGLAGRDRLDLTLGIDAPSLQHFWPGLAGSLRGAGRLQGSPALPVFTGDLRGSGLRLGDWFAESANLESRSSSAENVDMLLALNGIRYGDLAVGALRLSGLGNTTAMDVALEGQLAGREVAASAALESGPGALQGVITRVHVTDPQTGEWSVSGEPRFLLEGGSLTVGPHNWRGGGGELRVEGLSAGAGGLAFSGSLENMGLQSANPLLPPGYSLQGSADGDLDVRRGAGGWEGSVNWRQDGTVLRVRQEHGEPVDIRIPVLTIDTRLAAGGAEASAVIGIEPGVTGNLRADFERLSADAPFSAALELHGEEWSWLSAIVPQADQFAGAVNADLQAGGTLQSPTLNGGVTWRGGRVFIPALNAAIDEVSVDLAGAPDGTANISGHARAGTGTLSVSGTVAGFSNRDLNVRLQLVGENAELLGWPEYRVKASPDVAIQGDRDGWTINGDLRVPAAMITVKELPTGAVQPSPDVRIAGEAEPQAVPAGYSGELNLELGEDVRVNVFGLDTRLTGNLRFRVPRDRPPGAEGQVTLVGGVFSAYGQKLTIERGTLTFTGPLDDPLVDVRAVRVVETLKGPVTAGIHLRGRAQNLSSSVYSQPAMAEADALSYLVLGRPLNQATSAEGNELSGAAVALGLGRTTRITEQIARTFGLDQFTLAGDGGDATALVAGKQVNSRLYARYAYGVFSRIGTLLLRYRLSRRLTLEASAGENQSIDLLYTIEKP